MVGVAAGSDGSVSGGGSIDIYKRLLCNGDGETIRLWAVGDVTRCVGDGEAGVSTIADGVEMEIFAVDTACLDFGVKVYLEVSKLIFI